MITDAAFAAAMATLGPFESKPLLALAVSGGPDSMALAWLADRWAQAAGGRAAALIVDHSLRAESRAEAETARAALCSAGIEASVSQITELPPSAGKPAWARRERYRLLNEWAQSLGALHLLTAHHMDDQAETVLMRLARGSGVKGLAAILPAAYGGDLRLLRPLLRFSKSELAATARTAGFPIADDPSNRDAIYARTRMRAVLSSAGGDAARLAATAEALASDDAAIEHATAALAARGAQISPLGMIRLDRALLHAAPASVACRLLERAARMAAGGDKLIRRDRVIGLHEYLSRGENGRRTLGGAVVTAAAQDIVLWREPARLPAPGSLSAKEAMFWDGRFKLFGLQNQSADLLIGPLGYRGLTWLERLDERALKQRFPGAPPRQVLACLPALWRGEDLAGLTTFARRSPNNGRDDGFHGIRDIHVHFAPGTSLTVAATC